MPQRVSKGMKFRAVIADANPLWEVQKSLGGGSWLCVCIDEPFTIRGRTYPGEHAGTQKAFLSREILAAVDMENMYSRMASDHDRFYTSLKVGQIVHYNNGFRQFVRCEVVRGKDKEGKEGNVLKPTALVGEWSSHDLPRRSADGSVGLKYYPRKITEGETFTPNYTSICESPRYSRRAEEPDPRTLKPLDLSVPEITNDEAEKARLFRLRQEVIGVLSDHTKYPNHHDAFMQAYNLLTPECR